MGTRRSFDHSVDSVQFLPDESISSIQTSVRSVSRKTLRKKKITQAERKMFATYESFNYDQPENQHFQRRLEGMSVYDHHYEELLRWVVAFVIGLVTGFVGFYVHNLTKFLEELKYEETEKMIESDHGKWMAFIVYTAINALCCTFAGVLVAFIEPQAKGSGIPEVKSTLNGNHLPRVIRFRTLISKTFGIAFSVGGGLFVGKEGPMVHSGSIVAAGVSQGPSRALPSVRRFLRRFRNDKDKRDFVSMGCAAGVAAAFGAPMGGVLFSFEEASTHWSMVHTLRTFFCAMVTTSSMNFWLQFVYPSAARGSTFMSLNAVVSFGAFEGPALEDAKSQNYADLDGYMYYEFIFFGMIGVSSGWLAALFNSVNVKITHFRNKFFTNRCLRVVEVVLISIITSAATFWIPTLFSCYTPVDMAKACHAAQDGTGCPVVSIIEERWEAAEKCLMENGESMEKCVIASELKETIDEMRRKNSWMSHKKFFCKTELEVNPMATLTFESMPDTVKQFFHSNFPWEKHDIFIHFCVLWSIACLTYGISIPSGLFIPSVIVGASWGRFWGQIVQQYIGPLRTERVAVGAYALIGSASFLSGVLRTTISVAMILLEASNTATYVMPVMIATILAAQAGNMFNHGLFDMHIRIKCVPFLEHAPDEEMRLIRAIDVMNRPVVCFREVCRVREVVDVLRNNRHNGFPVIRELDDEDVKRKTGHFVGIILRTQLMVLLKEHRFTENTQSTYDIELDLLDESREDELLDELVFQSYYPKFPEIEHVSEEIPAEEMNLYMNLSPYLNNGAFTVRQGVKLDRIFKMFRMLGLRHLTVVDLENRVTGMITRKDLMPHKTAETLEAAEIAQHSSGN